MVFFLPLQALWNADALNLCYEARYARVTLAMTFLVLLAMLVSSSELISYPFSTFLSGEVLERVVTNILSVVFP
jgi:hypothetical protein